MTEKTATRTCTVCGKPFTVDPELLKSQQAAVAAGLDPSFIPSVPSTCKACAARPAVSEQRALEEVQRIAEEMNRSAGGEMLWYAKRLGMITAGAGVVIVLLAFALSMVSRGDFNPVPWVFVGALVLFGGAAVAYWGFTHNRNRD